MGIQINGQTDTISASDGGLAVSGYELTGPSNINVTGIVTAITFNGDVKVATGSTISGGTNYITASTNGSERLRIDSSGNIGVGTNAPSALLEANGGNVRMVDTNGRIYLQNGNTSNGAKIGVRGTSDATDGYLAFETNSIEFARFDSSGNFGVGTASPSTNTEINAALDTGASLGLNEGQLSIGREANSGGALRIGYDTTNNFGFISSGRVGTSWDNLILNAGGGNVLVGTTDTQGASHYYDDLVIKNDGASTGSGITLLGNASYGFAGIVFADSVDAVNGGAVKYSNNQDYMWFETVGTERARITNGGFFKASNTGSYNVATGQYHESYSNYGDWTHIIRNTNATPYGLLVTHDTDSNNTQNWFFYAQGSSTLRFQVRSNGGIANYQGNDANLCDEREKKNIEALDSTWGCLKNWELKKFHYNEDADTDDKRYGVIAQQVAEHCPEVITDWVKQEAKDAVLDEDGNVTTPAQEEIVRMGVKEQQMMWMAIKALQEAQTRIEELEAKVAALEAQ